MNNHYNLNYYLNDIQAQLQPTYQDITLCQQYAWWILQALCEKTKTELIMQETLKLSADQQEKYDSWMKSLVKDKMPLQYLLGSVPFADLDILVEPPTLIPRPETEEWCLNIIDQLLTVNNKKITILDIATGSGCIALACASKLPEAKIVALDIADSALALAEKNKKHNKISNITYIKSNLFESLPLTIKYDIILSNPPYISEVEFTELDETVTKWEDHAALVAPDDGLALIKKIIAQAPSFIETNNEMREKNIPQIVIEIGYAQGQAVKTIMEQQGYNNIIVHKDIEGKDRFVSARVD